jgi:outer membrane protein, heavy metal efflux system
MTLSHKVIMIGFTTGMLCTSVLSLASPANASQSNIENTQLSVSTLSLPTAVEVALADNPSLATMASRAEAFAAIPSQVGSLPDPKLSLNALNLPVDSFNVGQEGMTQMQIGFSQAFPFPGKLGLREEAAGHEAKAADSEVDETRLWLVRSVKSSWWQLFYLDKALEIVINNQVLLREFVKIARTKYTVGKGLQQDVLLAQLELSGLLDQQVRLNGIRRNEEARLNALLNWPTTRTLKLAKKTDSKLPLLLEEKKLHQQAETARPLLTAQRSRISAAHSRVGLAKKDYYPDFNLGAAYGFRSGSNNGIERPDVASLQFSMSLPIYTGSKQDRAMDQRNSELLKQKYKLQDTLEKVREEISRAMADYKRANEQTELYQRGIIPQARQTVDSMLAGYQVNKVDFLNLVRSQITLYNYETQYWLSYSSAHQALAALEAVVGTENIYAGDSL